MAKHPLLHRYSDRLAFERLLLLIATFVHYPGVGSATPGAASSTRNHHQALQAVQEKLYETARIYGVNLPSYSIATLRKDLDTLRTYGILDRRMYRWGYYLGTGALTLEELQLAVQALFSQAQHQGDAVTRRVYEQLEFRLRGLNLERDGQLFYPVRTQFNRAIVYTDPEEMMVQGEYRRTLFQRLLELEGAIACGQKIELYRTRDPYHSKPLGHLSVFPVQLIYADIAWYLLYEYADTGHFEVERVDRFSDFFKIQDTQGRGIDRQKTQLAIAHQLLTQGWGLYLGTPEEQQLERAGRLPLTLVTVRFFPPAMVFVLEGERRHPTQKLRKARSTSHPYVDYSVKLPGRSLNEFCCWVYRFMSAAQILVPLELAEKHCQQAAGIVQRYRETAS